MSIRPMTISYSNALLTLNDIHFCGLEVCINELLHKETVD